MKFINDFFETMEARRRRERRESALFLGAGCLVFIIIGLIMVVVGGIINAVETANVNSTYGEVYARTCQSMPAGQASDNNLTDATPPRQLLLLTANTQRRHAWHTALPTQWQAETEEEVSLIGCVEEETIVLETCEYRRDSPEGFYTVRIDREQYQTTIALVNPNTARLIDSKTVIGTDPPACPVDDGTLTSGEQSGDTATWNDFASWIEDYVF